MRKDDRRIVTWYICDAFQCRRKVDPKDQFKCIFNGKVLRIFLFSRLKIRVHNLKNFEFFLKVWRKKALLSTNLMYARFPPNMDIFCPLDHCYNQHNQQPFFRWSNPSQQCVVKLPIFQNHSLDSATSGLPFSTTDTAKRQSSIPLSDVDDSKHLINSLFDPKQEFPCTSEARFFSNAATFLFRQRRCNTFCLLIVIQSRWEESFTPRKIVGAWEIPDSSPFLEIHSSFRG